MISFTYSTTYCTEPLTYQQNSFLQSAKRSATMIYAGTFCKGVWMTRSFRRITPVGILLRASHIFVRYVKSLPLPIQGADVGVLEHQLPATIKSHCRRQTFWNPVDSQSPLRSLLMLLLEKASLMAATLMYIKTS